MAKKCIKSGCNRVHYGRGLCRPCYQQLIYRIRHGELTKEEAEERGEMLPYTGPVSLNFSKGLPKEQPKS